MKELRFLIATPWNQSALSQQYRALAKELTSRGHRVVLLAAGQAEAAIRPAGETAVYTWPSKRPTRLTDAWFLWRLIRRERPDCLVSAFGATNLMLLIGWLLSVRERVGWHQTMTRQIRIDWRRARRSGLLLRLLLLRKRLVLRLATNLVPVSEAVAADLHQVFGVPSRKCRVFHNSLGDPLSLASVADLQREAGTVVCPARLSHSKGQDVLLRAARELHEAFPEVRILFLGEGPERPALERLRAELGLGKMCEFRGEVSHVEVLQLMRSAAIVVVPSRDDACPLALIEALAVGTPVIASAVGGIPEMLQQGREGFLVTPDHPQELAGRLKQLFSQPELAFQLGRNARKRFLERFERCHGVNAQADWLESLFTLPMNATALRQARNPA